MLIPHFPRVFLRSPSQILMLLHISKCVNYRKPKQVVQNSNICLTFLNTYFYVITLYLLHKSTGSSLKIQCKIIVWYCSHTYPFETTYFCVPIKTTMSTFKSIIIINSTKCYAFLCFYVESGKIRHSIFTWYTY